MATIFVDLPKTRFPPLNQLITMESERHRGHINWPPSAPRLVSITLYGTKQTIQCSNSIHCPMRNNYSLIHLSQVRNEEEEEDEDDDVEDWNLSIQIQLYLLSLIECFVSSLGNQINVFSFLTTVSTSSSHSKCSNEHGCARHFNRKTIAINEPKRNGAGWKIQ